MGIFKKLGELARANLNHVIGQLEDPKKLADQAILDLKESRQKAERLLISVTASLKMAEEKLRPLTDKAALLMRKAEDFLKNSDEISAKEMLREKQDIDFAIKNLEQEIDENNQTKIAISRGIKALEDKINNLKSSSSLRSSEEAIHRDDAFATFARMEEKIESKEYEVLALNELLAEYDKGEPKKAAPSFDKHSDPAALEKELAAIKKKIKD